MDGSLIARHVERTPDRRAREATVDRTTRETRNVPARVGSHGDAILTAASDPDRGWTERLGYGTGHDPREPRLISGDGGD